MLIPFLTTHGGDYQRWIVERTFGWLTWYRRLSKVYEQLVEVSESFVYVAMIHLMLRRLHPLPTS